LDLDENHSIPRKIGMEEVSEDDGAGTGPGGVESCDENEGLVDGRKNQEHYWKHYEASLCTKLHAQRVAMTVICWGLLFALSSNLLPVGLGNLYVGNTSPACIPISAYAWTFTTSLILVAAAHEGFARPAPLVQLVSKSQIRRVELIFFVCNAFVFVAAVLPGVVRGRGVSGHLSEIITFWAAKAAWPSYWNLLVLVIPTVRVGGACAALGISHDAALHVHILTGNAVFWWVFVHTLLLSVGYALKYPKFADWLATMVPGIDGPWNRYTEAPVNFAGWLGFAFLLAVWVSSTKWARRHSYRVFAALHFMGFGFLFAATLHDYNTLHFVQPGIVAWIVDLILRRSMRHSVVLDPHSSEHAFSPSVTVQSNGRHCAITLPVEDGSLLMSAPQGSFLYVLVPHISRLEWHPLSITKVDSQSRSIFLSFKLVGPWTTSLARHLLEAGSKKLTICVEGPYGTNLSSVVCKYSHVLFISGGAGLAGIAGAAAEAQEHGTQCTCIWVTQCPSDATVYAPLLRMLTRAGVCPLQFFTQNKSGENMGAVRSTATRVYWKMSQVRSLSPVFVTLLTCLGFFIGLFLARMACCFRPVSVSGGSREVSVFGNVLETCAGDACTLPLCFLCFRGLPILGGFCLAYAFGAASMMLCPKLELTEPCPMTDCQSLVCNENGEDIRASTPTSEFAQAETWGRPSINLEIQNWSMGHPSGSRACVVVCGPSALHAAVKGSVDEKIDLLAVSDNR
jgi:hypothetical protein